MSFAYEFPYDSRRAPVLARNVVATSQPLAAQAGLRMLLAGGNAVDAALAAAITLTVVEPTSNGIGSDAFAIVWDGSTLHGLNASGRSPAAWTSERFAGLPQMPVRGWLSVSIPGAVSAWVALSQRFGKLPFEQLFGPAIGYARAGYAVSPITAAAWQRSVSVFDPEQFPSFHATFAPHGRAPAAGEVFRSEDHARTLESIAGSRGESFYRGKLAASIISHARQSGGLIDADDLATHQADWVNPISTTFGKESLHEIPPNGQGIAALLAMNFLSHLGLAAMPVDSADALHVQIEAMKLALADAYHHIGDPRFMRCSSEELLDPAYGAQRARQIDRNRAADPGHGAPRRGGTVYLTAADASGMMVSFIQSNFWGFGSGIVIPGTGIAMQNRGYGFVLEPGHANVVGPRKRPFHTIIPGFIMRQGQPLMSFGVMGGHMQAQGHVQMMTRIFTWNQNPQAASDAPRWRVDGGRVVTIEKGFPSEALDDLRRRGHDIRIGGANDFGGAQLIYKLENDAGYFAASDHRKDGQAVGY